MYYFSLLLVFLVSDTIFAQVKVTYEYTYFDRASGNEIDEPREIPGHSTFWIADGRMSVVTSRTDRYLSVYSSVDNLIHYYDLNGDHTTINADSEDDPLTEIQVVDTTVNIFGYDCFLIRKHPTNPIFHFIS